MANQQQNQQQGEQASPPQGQQNQQNQQQGQQSQQGEQARSEQQALERKPGEVDGLADKKPEELTPDELRLMADTMPGEGPGD